ncbi:MAG: hypothetical protein ACE5HC_05230 [Candidatus Binatia bacterium]
MTKRLPRFVSLIAVYLLLVVAGNYADIWVTDYLDSNLWVSSGSPLQWMILVSLGSYIVLMTLPFFPGIEIGLVLMAMLGAKICIVLYLCTVFALNLSFLIGRLIPENVILGALRFMGLSKAQELVRSLRPLDVEARRALLLSAGPTRVVPQLLKYRSVALAVALNLPGNALLGGGGGIGLIAGLTGLISFPKYILTVALAVAPLPLIVMLRDAMS